MSDPALALQGALVAAVKALATDAGVNVFDTVPASDPFPRVTIGQGQSVGNYADCYDGTESFLQIDAWARGSGFREVKSMASAIRDLINAGAIEVPGHTVELLEVTDTVYTRDPDGITSRARINVRALTQPTD